MELRLLFSSLSMSLWLLVCWQQQIYGCYGCVEEERRALLDIRAAFDIPGQASNFVSWLNDGSNCCGWERVKCGSITGRVIRLSLDQMLPFSNPPYTLNATLFLPLQELRSLDLSFNHINDCLPTAGFDRLSNLRKLEYLDLSWNSLNGKILPSLAELTSLKALSLKDSFIRGSLPIHGFLAWSKLSKLEYLDLSENMFNASIIPDLVGILSLKTLLLSLNNMDGSLPIRGLQPLSKLSKLEYLDLSENGFNESIIPDLVGISSLKTLLLRFNNMGGTLPIQELSTLSLEVLDLSQNGFVGGFPTLVEEWTSLKAISLSHNKLNDTLHIQGLCKIKNLQELDLSQNDLIGVLPSCLGNLTYLRFFDASNNHLNVNFPSHVISNLTSLEYLSLSNNQLEGILCINSLSNHSNLKVLEIAGQNNKLEVETESPVATPSFQLEGVILSYCTLNRDFGAIPSFLSTQYALQWIDLSNNNLRGHIPDGLLENKTGLHYLSLRSNSLIGHLILPSQLNSSASWLDFSSNEFDGELPTNMDIRFPNLISLSLSGNSFQGTIPSSFGSMEKLENLYLSNNNLSGKITDNLLTNTSLSILYLSNNKFDGRIPVQSNKMSGGMFLDGNRLTGEIPSTCNYSNLGYLDISRNQLSGMLPNCMGNFPPHYLLNAEGNHFEGPIPNAFCNMTLDSLDLSSNNLSGSIPPCFYQYNLLYLRLHDNGLTGSFPVALSRSPELITIDISNNHLTGKLPSWTDQTNALRSLVLKGNHFEGSIPNQMCRLKLLRILDLSHNNISGHIPRCLNKMGYDDGYYVPFGQTSDIYTGDFFPSYRGLLPEKQPDVLTGANAVDEVEFTTKNISNSYKGNILNYLAGLDLSCNQLVGDIPWEMGNMSWLQTLNLSNNHLRGPIPRSFSNLTELESMDLSHNLLTGPIPRELIELHFLEDFSVAYNNLSGPTPGTGGQFSTFSESSYEGNPNLCGFPLEKNCYSTPKTKEGDEGDDDTDDDDDAIDRLIFFASFALAFGIGFWGFMALLYFKTHWRYALFLATDRYSETFYTKICVLLARIKAFWKG